MSTQINTIKGLLLTKITEAKSPNERDVAVQTFKAFVEAVHTDAETFHITPTVTGKD